MKKVIVLAVVVTMSACHVERDIQVNLVNAELVKIDTIFRNPGKEQLLVWKCSKNIQYVSYRPINEAYTIGTRMLVMVPR